MEFRHHPERMLRHALSIPFVYAMIVPLVFADICFEIYHRVCFPLYGIPYVSRSAYIKIDRYRLSYLIWWEKGNCLYCGYANGLLHYLSAIAAETEKYWCGIKHAKDPHFIPPEHHKGFLPYGDEKAYNKFLKMKEPHE